MSDPTQQPETQPSDPIAAGIVERVDVDVEAGDVEADAVEAGDPEGGQPEPDSEPTQAAAPADAEVIGAADSDAVGLAGEEEAGEAIATDDEDAADDSDTDDDDSDADDDAADAEPVMAVAPSGPIEELSEEEQAEDINLDWYILKVQSNRERTSSEALKRKVAIEGIDHLFGEIIVPTEKVTEFKNGKKKTVQRKIWPGYIAVQMHVNDDTWFAIRETAGIGDFTGASGKPIPMSPADVEKILPKEEGEESEDETPKLNIKFAEGDKVKVTDGNFENFEGDVDSIDQQSGKITVMISIFGRSTPVELEYWQVEKL